MQLLKLPLRLGSLGHGFIPSLLLGLEGTLMLACVLSGLHGLSQALYAWARRQTWPLSDPHPVRRHASLVQPLNFGLDHPRPEIDNFPASFLPANRLLKIVAQSRGLFAFGRF